MTETTKREQRKTQEWMSLMAITLFLGFSLNLSAQIRTDKETDGLKGRVKSVSLERATISRRDGQSAETTRILLSVTTYDEKGNRVEEVRYNSNGSLAEKTTFARDENGNQTTTRYKADGTMSAKWVSTFDASGKMTSGAQYAPDGSLRLKMVRKFDANGKLIEGAMYNADGSLMNKTLFKYDAEGQQAEDTVYDASGVLMQKYIRSNTGDTVTLYDKNGAISYKSVSQSSSLEFDSHENWIKRTTPRTITQGEKVEEEIEVAYRAIIYY